MPKLITASYRQRKFVHALLKHGSIKKAAQEAYNTTDKTAYLTGRATLNSPSTQEYMKRIMEKAGITEDAVANGLKVVMEAGLRENSLKQSNPSHALKALEMSAKLLNMNPPERKEIKKTSVNLKLEGKSEEELKSLLDEKLKELSSFKNLLNKQSVPGIVLQEVNDSN